MGLPADFDDRQTQIESEAETYHPYEYQTDNNGSWAGALPVKQYALPQLMRAFSSTVAMLTRVRYRGLYDPSLEKDACGVGFAWYEATVPVLSMEQLV